MSNPNRVQIYDFVSSNETFFSFVIYYIKVAFIHSFLEVVITLFTIDALIVYSDMILPNIKEVVDSEFMGYFFSSTLFACGVIFVIYSLSFYIFLKKTLKKIMTCSHEKRIEECKKFCCRIIKIGFVSYCLVGVLAAISIEFIVGDCVVLTSQISIFSKVQIAIAIICCGTFWAITSITRIWRVDWDRIFDEKIESKSTDNCFRDKRIKAIIVNVILQIIFIILLVYSFGSSILTNIDSEYINTYLALYFSIMSVYIGLYYTLEFKHCHILFGRIDNL